MNNTNLKLIIISDDVKLHRILTHLINDALKNNYKTVYLDSPDFCTAAHQMYEAFGFQYTHPYPGNENPEETHQFLKFMKLDLIKEP